jgi:hypothetical protein
VTPVVLAVLKPIYKMLALQPPGNLTGQPLQEIKVVLIPNGLLLQERPGYLRQHPGLLFPGKDDKQKNPLKLRARISFPILRQIDAWRVQTISLP